MADSALAAVPVSSAWGQGSARRFLALGASRVVTQGLALAWFLAAARLFADREFGVVAAGLAFFSIFAGLGDAGTTRTVVRFVAADPRTVWPVYRRALKLRIIAGASVGLATAGIIALTPAHVSPVVVVAAAAIAVASGASELAYAALRSVGKVRIEMTTLVIERAVFLAIAIAAIVTFRAGPLTVLWLYAATNGSTAVISGFAVYRARSADERDPGTMIDPEARRTAVAFALYVVTPRIVPILLAVLSGTTALAVFSVAQDPIEAMTLFALSTAAPLLPIVRAHVVDQRVAAAVSASTSVAGALAAGLAPVLAWCIVAPTQVVDLLFGAHRYQGASFVLALLAAGAMGWILRGVGELLLLAHERASTFLRIMAIGAVTTLVSGVPLVLVYGAGGAAVATILTEVVMTFLLVCTLPRLLLNEPWRSYGPAVMIGVGTALTLLLSSRVAISIVMVSGWTLIGLLAAVRLIRRLEPPTS